MNHSKLPQTLLAAALLSLGVPASTAFARGQETSSAQPQIDLDQVRRTVDTLLAEMKQDAVLAKDFQREPRSVLSARGIPATLHEDLLRELFPETELRCSRTCDWTCDFTSI